MQKILSVLLAVVMVFTLAACSSNTTPTATKPVATQKPDAAPAAGDDQSVYKIGLAGMMTGDNALNGEHMRDAVQLAFQQRNAEAGYEKFVLQIEDDLTTNEGALTAVQKLISDGVLAIVGPHRSAAVLAVSETVQKSECALLVGGTSVSIDGSNPWVFRTRASDGIMASVAAKFADETFGAKKVGMLYCSDDYGSGAADVAIAYFEANGIEYDAQVHNVNDVDFTSSILAIQASGCDTVFVWTHDAETAIIMQQLSTYLPNINVIAAPGITLANVIGLCEPEWLDGKYSVTDYVPGADDPIIAEFEKAYTDLYGYQPDLYSAAYYGAAVTLMDAVEALEAAGTEVTRQTLRDQLDLSAENQLPSGIFYADEKHNLVHSCAIARMDGVTPTFYATVNE